MAKELSTSPQNILALLVPVFGKVEEPTLQLRESLAALPGIDGMISAKDERRLSLDDGSCQKMLHLLALCLNETRILKSSHLAEAFSVFADASRDPKWRLEFGRCESHSSHPGWPPDPSHELHNYNHEEWSRFESESVLQIAVRTLHARYVEHLGQAGYHALRLISNCCADNDPNKRVVLECGGVELLLRCATKKLWPDIVTTALWNICAQSEVLGDTKTYIADGSGSSSPKCLTAIEPDIASIARFQLGLRSTGECDDLDQDDVLEDQPRETRRHTNIVCTLLNLADSLNDDSWKEMVSELLGHATWHTSWAPKGSSPGGDATDIPESSRLKRPETMPKNFLLNLLKGSGRSLAMSNSECLSEVLKSIAFLMSHVEIQRALINHDLVSSFLETSKWEPKTEGVDESGDSSMSKAVSVARQSLLKATYDLSALPEFSSRYGKAEEVPRLVEECIDAILPPSKLENTKKAVKSISAASACVILANLTQSTEYASFLTQRKHIHQSLALLLRQWEDSATIFPALALLDRLAIPQENKTAMFSAGFLYDLPRFLIGFDVQPGIQREAVSVMRKIVAGHPERVRAISVCKSGEPEDGQPGRTKEKKDSESGLLASWNLFKRTNDDQIKMEIGRLIVEVCRILFHSIGEHPEQAKDGTRSVFGRAIDIACPLAYLICNAASRDIQGEGWFGLAMLSTWEFGRPFVVQSLGNEDVQRNLEIALREGDRAFQQNISLMLTKLHLVQTNLVSAQTRDFLERAAKAAGIPPIWKGDDAVA